MINDPYTDFFRGKKVTVQGLGLLGRSIGDIRFISEMGGIVTVTDMKSEVQLRQSIEELSDSKNITFHLGGHQEPDFTDADMVIKSAGVPLRSPFIEMAEKAGVPVYMSTALAAHFARQEKALVVGVTGTRGKTTVTHAIAHIISKAGLMVHLGGNIRGVSTLALVPQIHAGDVLVLELDSWQLQGFRTLKVSPEVAVFTNLMPDHQNYYGDMQEYFNDKAAIFENQRTGDALISGSDIAQQISAHPAPVQPHVPPPLPKDWEVIIPGVHNLENLSLAAAAARDVLLRCSKSVFEIDGLIRDGIATFGGVEGRLQFVKNIRGVAVYNDNNATTPEATCAAIRALTTHKTKNIILVAGGSDKGLPFDMLEAPVGEGCKAVLLLKGTGTENMLKVLPGARVHETLQGAVFAAMNLAVEGDIILFSPACASFGMFVNEYDRNDQFLKIVASL